MNYYEMLLAQKLAKGELPPNAYLLKTASGSLVSFSDGADLPMPSFICNIDAVQDLHGYDGPWVGGAGKNKLPMTVDGIKALNTAGTWSGNAYTLNNITFTLQTNASGAVTGLNVNGTASANTTFWIKKNDTGALDFADGTSVILSGCPSGGSWDDTETYALRLVKNNYLAAFNDTGSGKTVTYNSMLTLVYIDIKSGVSLNNKMFYPMIRLATETDATFAPYSNICPISGHTGVDAWVRGKNLFDATNLINDRTIDTNGDLSGYGGRVATPDYIPVKPNTSICLSYSKTVSQNVVFIYALYKDGTLISRVANNPMGAVIQTENANQIRFAFYDSVSASDLYNIQLEYGNTATSYEPYNTNSQTIKVSWQTEAGEVFGGYVDLVSGVLTATHKSQTGFTRGSQDSSNKLYNIGTIADIKAFTDARNISPYFIDSMFEKMSLQSARTAETPSIAQHDATLYVGGYIGKETELDTLLETLQVKYELATPITYQLTPTQIKSLLGNNNAWCNTGDVTLEYFGKGDA